MRSGVLEHPAVSQTGAAIHLRALNGRPENQGLVLGAVTGVSGLRTSAGNDQRRTHGA